MIKPLPISTPWVDIDLKKHGLTGWPREGVCPHCGARAVHLWSTSCSASYECRGTPTDPHSAYGPDRCGRVFKVKRDAG